VGIALWRRAVASYMRELQYLRPVPLLSIEHDAPRTLGREQYGTGGWSRMRAELKKKDSNIPFARRKRTRIVNIPYSRN
jgi:hypothetical protein